jgi:aryl-alcohol dehydrogenase-like predicted oxidoreductase
MHYGIANSSGLRSEKDVFSILDAAFEAGITTIDTARNYGLAELRIGRWLSTRRPASFHIVTKIPALAPGSGSSRKRELLEHLAVSRRVLNIDNPSLVLAHQDTDLFDTAVVDALLTASDAHLIGGFGASTYSPDVAARLISDVPIAALQVPANLLDRRFEDAGIFAQAAAKGVAVFVRSVFLQGALVGDPAMLPAHLKPLARVAGELQNIARQAGYSLSRLLITPIRDTPGVTSIILGIDNQDQLPPHFAAGQAAGLPPLILDRIRKVASALPAEFADASRWKHLAK